MATSDSNRGQRRMRGFEPAVGLMRARIRAAGEARGFAVSRLLTQWAEVVGEDIAALCRPVKVGYGRQRDAADALGATLTVLAHGSAAPLVQMRLPVIRDRVNACYGYHAIARVQVTQTSGAIEMSGLAEDAAAFRVGPRVTEPPPEVEAAAGALTAEIADPDLRAALSGLARLVLSKTPM